MRQQPPLLKTQRRQAVKVLQRSLRLPLRIKEEQKIANHQTKIRTINQERKVRELKKMMRRSRRHLVWIKTAACLSVCTASADHIHFTAYSAHRIARRSTTTKAKPHPSALDSFQPKLSMLKEPLPRLCNRLTAIKSNWAILKSWSIASLTRNWRSSKKFKKWGNCRLKQRNWRKILPKENSMGWKGLCLLSYGMQVMPHLYKKNRR